MRLAALALVAAALAVAAPAHADPDGLTVNSHGVVISSTLPHCAKEDGSGGQRPCTWNIGPGQNGNGQGLQYWVGANHAFHYVWNRSPLINHPDRVWSQTQPRCWLNASTGIGKCPNGDTAT